MLVKQLLVKNVAVFDQVAVVCQPVRAVCVHCCAVHYLGEKDQDDDLAVLYNINL